MNKRVAQLTDSGIYKLLLCSHAMSLTAFDNLPFEEQLAYAERSRDYFSDIAKNRMKENITIEHIWISEVGTENRILFNMGVDYDRLMENTVFRTIYRMERIDRYDLGWRTVRLTEDLDDIKCKLNKYGSQYKQVRLYFVPNCIEKGEPVPYLYFRDHIDNGIQPLKEAVDMFGYTYDGMTPITYKAAREKFEKGEEVYLLFDDNTECVCQSEFDLHEHADYGYFGVEK